MTDHSRSSSRSSGGGRHALEVGLSSVQHAPPSATSSSTAPSPPPPALALSSSSSPSPSKSLSSPPYRYGAHQVPSVAQQQQQQMYRTPPTTGRGGGKGTSGEDSVGESFLALNSDSSPLGASTSATYGRTGEESNDMTVLAAVSSSYSSPSTTLTPSQEPYKTRAASAAADDVFADADHVDMTSPRFRKSRGTRLGMQMKASTHATTPSTSAVTSRAPLESNIARTSPSTRGKMLGATLEAVQPLRTRTNGTSAVERISEPNDDRPTRTGSQSLKAPACDMPTSSPAEKGKVGQLSDGAIVQLGATPGMDPTSLLNADGVPLSSKNILTIALQKAQSAVLLDSSNNVSEAIMAYRQAVRLLQEVMERVSPKLGSPTTATSRQSSRRHNREEERRRLKVIHDTYADRIRLLSMINTPDAEEESNRTDESDFLLADAGDSTMGSETTSARMVAQNPTRTKSPTQAPAISISRETNGRMTEVAHDVEEQGRRMEDELMTPTTPYFDVDPLLGSNDETYSVERDNERATPRHAALLDAPAMSITGSAQSALSTYGRRPMATSQRSRQQERAQTPPTRPPQMTPPQAPRVTAASDAALVSSTTSAGSIIQRRKNSVAAANVFVPPANTSSDPVDAVTSTSTAPAAGSGVGDGTDERDTSRTSSSSGRKRAISQPGSRRPSIPASFLAAAGRLAGGGSSALPAQQTSPPPVPPLTIARKASMPLGLLSPAATMAATDGRALNDGAYSQLTVRGLSAGRPLPSPSPSSYSGYHTLGTPLVMSFPVANGGGLTSGDAGERATILSDIFPAALPSVLLGTHASFASNTVVLSLPWLGVLNAPPEAAKAVLPDARVLRPFHTMRQLLASIERGAWVTDRLFVAREVWLSSGNRLLAVETKVRMVELMAASLDGLGQAGQFLLQDPTSHPPSSTSIHVAHFVKQLDVVEAVMDEVQATLAKKLGYTDGGGGGGGGATGHTTSASSGTISLSSSQSSKRSNLNAFNSLSSKLQRSLNSMVAHNSKHAVDLPVSYAEALARLFARAQVLGDHLSALLRAAVGGVGGTYGGLSDDLRAPIEQRLKRASKFFASVILRFVLRDVSILVDKSIKRSAAMMIE